MVSIATDKRQVIIHWDRRWTILLPPNSHLCMHLAVLEDTPSVPSLSTEMGNMGLKIVKRLNVGLVTVYKKF